MMPVIATITISLFLLLGALVQLQERGYAFDLRKRKNKASVRGGRRASDR